MQSSRILKNLHNDLKDGKIEPNTIYATLHRFGDAMYLPAKPIIESYLTHPDPSLRYIALNVLIFHWGCHEHRSTCERFITDPDEEPRRMGVAGLGALLKNTRDREALMLLLRVFSNEDEDQVIRDCAYNQILKVLGKPDSEQPPIKKLDYTKDINWEYIIEAKKVIS